MVTKKSKSGSRLSSRVGLAALRQQFTGGASGNDLVTVQDWQVSSGNEGLTESCTVRAQQADGSISGVGLLAYSADGATLYCSQYTADTGGSDVSPSLTWGQTSFESGAQVLGVVFGYIEGAEFFFEQVMQVSGSSTAKTTKGGRKVAARPALRSGKKPGGTKRRQTS